MQVAVDTNHSGHATKEVRRDLNKKIDGLSFDQHAKGPLNLISSSPAADQRNCIDQAAASNGSYIMIA